MFRVEGSGSRVQEFRVEGSGLKVQGGVQGCLVGLAELYGSKFIFIFTVQSSEFRVNGLEFGVYGLVFFLFKN